jgi:O-methyltransferase
VSGSVHPTLEKWTPVGSGSWPATDPQRLNGRVGEWFKPPVLKTGGPKGSVSSNLTSSSISMKIDPFEYIPVQERQFYDDLTRLFIPHAGISAFREIHSEILSRTLVSMDRCYVLWALLNSIVKRNVPGVFIEAGVYKGGTARMVRQAARLLGSPILIHLYDTFSGMPKTSKFDHHEEGDFSDTSLAQVKAFVGDVGVLYHKGLIQHTLKSEDHGCVALVHLDVDVYDSYAFSLDALGKRMSRGGAILCDDYGFHSCYGGRKAIDEYCEREDQFPIVLPTGQALLLF